MTKAVYNDMGFEFKTDDFTALRQNAVDELKKCGFGLVSEINLPEKFKAKLNKDFRPYIILGACSPAIAFKAVNKEPDLGLLLPCNVCVGETTTKGTFFCKVINPLVMFSLINNKDLEGMADEIVAKLNKFLDAMKKIYS